MTRYAYLKHKVWKCNTFVYFNLQIRPFVAATSLNKPDTLIIPQEVEYFCIKLLFVFCH